MENIFPDPIRNLPEADIPIDGIKNEYSKGDIYFIPENIKHAGNIHAGYADIIFFNESDRYKKK